MVTEVESKLSTVEMLRKVAGIIERENLKIEFVNIGLGKVYLVESEFRPMFSGQVLAGPRDGDYVTVAAKAYGLVWESRVYSPVQTRKQPVEYVEV
jgi:hypothetical protein